MKLPNRFIPFIFCGTLLLSLSLNCSAQAKKEKTAKPVSIDLSHWSVTTPELDPATGKVTNVEPPQILDYANNELLKKNMYNDPKTGALVFYAYPSEGKTANTSFSRSELREQMVPGNNNINWTFKQGGTLKAEMAMGEVSREGAGLYSKVIILQIHGRLTDEQKKLIGQKDHNAPPVLKILWQNGKIRIKTKVLKNPNATYEEMLQTDAWTDDEGYNFKEKVDFNKFTLEVKVKEGRMAITLNNDETKVYENESLRKWNIFENYFKAGNYFQSKEPGTFAKVNFYRLSVSH